jgi:hypothetical protein
MAKIDLKFIDELNDSITSKIKLIENSIKISIWYGETNTQQSLYLDKSTAIKFAKTLRTEINKIKDEDDFERLSNTF